MRMKKLGLGGLDSYRVSIYLSRHLIIVETVTGGTNGVFMRALLIADTLFEILIND